MARAEASEHHINLQRLDLELQIRSADENAHSLLQRADLYDGLTAETDIVRKAFLSSETTLETFAAGRFDRLGSDVCAGRCNKRFSYPNLPVVRQWICRFVPECHLLELVQDSLVEQHHRCHWSVCD